MDENELELVHKAIQSGLKNCVDWLNDQVVNRVRSDPSLQGLQPNYIKGRVIEFITREGGRIDQREEKRPEWRHHHYWYRVVFPEPDFPHGIFVEIILTNPDQDCPEVALVNAHAQKQ